MSRQQRAQIDVLLRHQRPQGPRSVEELRTGFRALMARMNVPDAIRTTRTVLGDRPALRIDPDNGPRAGTILYFHGGGWVFGSPETALPLTGHLVAKTGFTAYSPQYRLAPEHPFPAAIDDTLSAYRALIDGGTDPSTIAFAGDSAGGGGLTVTTCLAARDAGLPLPAAVVAFSPASTRPARARAWTPRKASTRSSPAGPSNTPGRCTSPEPTPVSLSSVPPSSPT